MEKYDLVEEKQNPLLKRKEIRFSLISRVTPSRIDVEKLISEKFSSSPEKIKIKKINSRFGINQFIIDAHIYVSKEDKNKTEIKTKKESASEKIVNKTGENAKTEESSFEGNN